MWVVGFATLLPLAALLVASGAVTRFAWAAQRPWLLAVLVLLLLMAVHQGMELRQVVAGWAVSSSPLREIPETLVNLGASVLVIYLGFVEARLNAVRRERDKVAASDDAKSRFLSSMSHEFRTPLNAVLGFSEVIRDRRFGDDTEAYARYAGDIHRSAQHLLALVDDVLDAGRLERNAYTLSEERVDVGEVLASATTLVQPLATEHGVPVEHNVDDNLPAVRADERALRQIVINLTSNAVKFSSPGLRVTVTAYPVGDGLEIAVADEGPGIPQQDVDRILRPFERGHQREVSHPAAHDGAGLGLAISHKLATQHGGDLELDSTPGVGTTARLWLPPSRVQKPAEQVRA